MVAPRTKVLMRLPARPPACGKHSFGLGDAVSGRRRPPAQEIVPLLDAPMGRAGEAPWGPVLPARPRVSGGPLLAIWPGPWPGGAGRISPPSPATYDDGPRYRA